MAIHGKHRLWADDPLFDSSDEELEEEEPLEDRQKKRAKLVVVERSNKKAASAAPSIGGAQSGPLPYGPPSSARGNPNSQWNWVPGHYVPPPGSQVPPPWIAGPSAWEQASWQPVASGVRPSDSTSRKKKHTAYELGSQEHGTATGKPSFVVV